MSLLPITLPRYYPLKCDLQGRPIVTQPPLREHAQRQPPRGPRHIPSRRRHYIGEVSFDSWYIWNRTDHKLAAGAEITLVMDSFPAETVEGMVSGIGWRGPSHSEVWITPKNERLPVLIAVVSNKCLVPAVQKAKCPFQPREAAARN